MDSSKGKGSAAADARLTTGFEAADARSPTSEAANARLDQWTFGVPTAVTAAIRTGMFAELLRQPLSAAELAQRLNLDLRATTLVLDVLVTQELVLCDGDQYAPGVLLLHQMSRPGGALLQLSMWGHVETFLRTGEPFIAMDQSPTERAQVYRGVVGDLGKMLEEHARTLAAALPVHPRSVLDVGCGSGVWGLAVAERFPEAHITGLDLPGVLDNFVSRAASLGLTERTSTIAGDMHAVAIESNVASVPTGGGRRPARASATQDIGAGGDQAPRHEDDTATPTGGFDLAIIANVLRLETPDRAASLVKRIARAVAPGGAMLIVDALTDGTKQGAEATAVYALHLGLRTRSGQVHTAETIAGWLAAAGLRDVRPIAIPNSIGAMGALLATATT